MRKSSVKIFLYPFVLPLIILTWISFIVLFFTVLVPIIIFRFLLANLVPQFKKNFGKILPAQGTLFPLSVVEIFYVEGDLKVEEMRESFKNKVIELKDKNGNLKYPEFQQHLQLFSGFLFWKWDKNFKIENHISVYDASRLKNHNELITHLQRDGVFQEKKSPWNIFLVRNLNPNLKDFNGEIKENISTVIFHFSHEMMDGFSVVTLLYETMAAIPVSKFKIPPKSNLFLLLVKFISMLFQRTYFLLVERENFFDINQWHTQHLDVDYKQQSRTHMSPHVTQTGLIQNIQQKFKVCRSTVILTCVTAAIRKAMIRKGETIPEIIRMWQPYPRECHPGTLRDHFDLSEISLPVGLSNPLERLEYIRKEIIKSQDGVIQLASQIGMQIVGCMPKFLQRYIARTTCTTVIFSRLTFPPKLTLFDRNVIHYNATTGVFDGDTPCHIYCVGYEGYLRICLHIKSDTLDENEVNDFFSFINEELNQLINFKCIGEE